MALETLQRALSPPPRNGEELALVALVPLPPSVRRSIGQKYRLARQADRQMKGPSAIA